MCEIVWSKKWKDTIHYKRFCGYKPKPLVYEKCAICGSEFWLYPEGRVCMFKEKTDEHSP